MEVHWTDSETSFPLCKARGDGASSSSLEHVTCLGCIYKMPEAFKEMRIQARRLAGK